MPPQSSSPLEIHLKRRFRLQKGFVLTVKNKVMTGTIAKIVSDRGFGFIKTEVEGDKDLFFHARSVVGDTVYDDLKEGDTVTYEVEEGPKGPAAINVAKA